MACGQKHHQGAHEEILRNDESGLGIAPSLKLFRSEQRKPVAPVVLPQIWLVRQIEVVDASPHNMQLPFALRPTPKLAPRGKNRPGTLAHDFSAGARQSEAVFGACEALTPLWQSCRKT